MVLNPINNININRDFQGIVGSAGKLLMSIISKVQAIFDREKDADTSYQNGGKIGHLTMAYLPEEV